MVKRIIEKDINGEEVDSMHIQINKDLILKKENIIAAERTEEGQHEGLHRSPDEVTLTVECADEHLEFEEECDFEELKKALLVQQPAA